MLTVLVVDDEYLVRKGIQETIDWESYGFRVVGEAANGEEALGFAVEHRPDIVITDIRMPIMDGLEFMDKVREAGSDARIIVLSGYGEFDYARAAMNNGAVAYLLKPIENQQLIDTVVKVGQAIIKERNTAHYYNRLQNELPTLKKQFLLDLIHGEIRTLPDVQAKMALLDLPLSVSAVSLIAFFVLDDYKMAVQQLPPQRLEELRRIILGQFSPPDGSDMHAWIFEKSPGEWVAVAQFENQADPVGWLKDHCKKMVAQLKNEPEGDLAKMTFSVGISNPHPLLTDLRLAYDEAAKAAGQKFLPGITSIVAFADDGTADCRAEVKKAIAYIRTHYAENITVETAAKELFISPSHLMHLFKSELGKTFNDSLIDYRIEMAKELLKEPQCRIYEVCQKVGYNDTKYFSQLFKKITGMTPTDYVKKIS